MTESSLPFEPAESGRLTFGRSASGDRQIIFRMSGSWFAIGFLGLWMCGWLAGEVVAIGTVFFFGGAGTGFTLIWLVAWTLAGTIAGGFLLWMLFGRETMAINPDRLDHTYEIFSFRRQRAFDSAQIGGMRHFERRNRKSTTRYLEVEYGTRNVRVFHGIESAEAAAAIAVIEDGLGRRAA